MSAVPVGPSDASRQELDELAEHVARLLEDLRVSAGPTLWPRVEELARSLVELYGAGLERVLEHAREHAREPAALVHALVTDHLIGGLLALHDLHPVATRERVEQALGALRAAEYGAAVTLVALTSTEASIRVTGAADLTLARALSRRAVRAIEEMAPELEQVSVEGLETALPSGLISVESLLGRRS
jgi:hypothetical protein